MKELYETGEWVCSECKEKQTSETILHKCSICGHESYMKNEIHMCNEPKPPKCINREAEYKNITKTTYSLSFMSKDEKYEISRFTTIEFKASEAIDLIDIRCTDGSQPYNAQLEIIDSPPTPYLQLDTKAQESLQDNNPPKRITIEEALKEAYLFGYEDRMKERDYDFHSHSYSILEANQKDKK